MDQTRLHSHAVSERTDRGTDGQVIPIYRQTLFAGGIKTILMYTFQQKFCLNLFLCFFKGGGQFWDLQLICRSRDGKLHFKM